MAAPTGAANGYLTLVPAYSGGPAAVSCLVNKDSNGALTVPSEIWQQNSSGDYVPVGGGSTGTSLPVALTGSSATDAQANSSTPAVGGMLWNGTGWDRARTPTSGTLLASAARTTTTASATQTNYNARGVIVYLDVTVAGASGGLALQVQHQVAATATFQSITLSPTTVTQTGYFIYVMYPGAAATNVSGLVAQVCPIPLGRSWKVAVTVNTTDSYTYSVSYDMIP